MTILVTGGAGYIGAHVVRLLRDRGDDVLVVDDLSTGSRARVPGTPVLELDLADPGCVEQVADAMTRESVDAVVHFAARKQVGESVARPAWYFQQNVSGLAHVLLAMEAARVDKLVFSSSAAVYGTPATASVDESAPLVPVNPYGETKLVGEWLVRDAQRAWGLRSASLRYFNVAGAGWPELGDPAVMNLVTMVLERLTQGQRPQVFGTDYPTPDGSCVRDFVHVLDLAHAHLAALDYLDRDVREHDAFNVGTGTGVSVLEMVEALGRATGLDATPLVRERRAGDPASVVASVDRIGSVLGWTARSGLTEIVESAWAGWAGAGHGGQVS